MSGKAFNFAKKIYKKLPFNYKTKDKMKAVFYKCFSFVLKDTASYKAWNIKNDKVVRLGKIQIEDKELNGFECSKKIAIQLHLFYIDLADEFFEYFSNIPYKFDLLVSIIDKSKEDYVYSKFEKLSRVNKVIVKTVKNRGRDVAPLLSGFGEEVLNYDIICHVHSKKSLYTGGEQTLWRRYLLSSLFGSEKIVKEHLYVLEKGDNVGIVYPETFYALPYTGHTWLKNKASRDELMSRIGVYEKSDQIYFDYPMGTMFWAKVEALKQFFDAKIKLEEFPEEKGQVDGTIAHAFERCVTGVVKHNSYNIAIYSDKTDDYVYNNGLKNMNQYFIKSYDGIINEAKNYDVVTFDIFDTIFLRKVAKPQDVLLYTQSKINGKYGKDFSYIEYRTKAEELSRRKNAGKDINIDDIYIEFGQLCKDKQLTCEIKKIEIEAEKSLIVPEEKMIDVLNYIHDTLGKKVLLISDMHLTKDIIEDMLSKCVKVNYDELYVSCETNMRKDNGEMWKWLRGEYGDSKILHIGDNELSDVHIPMEYDISNYHIMSSLALFQNTNIGQTCKITSYDNLASGVMLGLVLNKSFSDKYRYNDSKFIVCIDDFYELGYSFIAPAILEYMIWLIKETKSVGADKIMLFAREGYILKEAFDVIKKKCEKVSDINAEYLCVSRRALSYASLRTKEDIEEVLGIYYLGKMKDLIYNRFGLEIKNLKDEEIRLPGDDLKVMKHLEPYIDIILNDAAKKRNDYLEYYRSIASDNKMVISDIGYSGTIQYFLSKVTKDVYYGRYFATDEAKKPLKIEGNDIIGLFSDGVANKYASDSAIHRYDLLFESIMIAPVGQLLYVENGNMVYTEENNPLFTDGVRASHKGILDFISDYMDIMGDKAMEELPDKNIPDSLIRGLIENKCIGNNIAKELLFEDKYCGNVKNNLMEEYFKTV